MQAINLLWLDYLRLVLAPRNSFGRATLAARRLVQFDWSESFVCLFWYIVNRFLLFRGVISDGLELIRCIYGCFANVILDSGDLQVVLLLGSFLPFLHALACCICVDVAFEMALDAAHGCNIRVVVSVNRQFSDFLFLDGLLSRLR